MVTVWAAVVTNARPQHNLKSSGGSQHRVSIGLKAKQVNRHEATCPMHIYESILELMEQCNEEHKEDNKTKSTDKVLITGGQTTPASSALATSEEPANPLTTTAVPTTVESVMSTATTTVNSTNGESVSPHESISIPSVLPPQCSSDWTLNLTEGFRNRTRYQSELMKDNHFLDSGRYWFRFQGSAGTQLANLCPSRGYPYPYGCGWYTGSTNYAYWSNSTMPKTVGETTQIRFYYGCNPNNYDVYRGLATRCTDDIGGLVYNFVDSMRQTMGVVCGNGK